MSCGKVVVPCICALVVLNMRCVALGFCQSDGSLREDICLDSNDRDLRPRCLLQHKLMRPRVAPAPSQDLSPEMAFQQIRVTNKTKKGTTWTPANSEPVDPPNIKPPWEGSRIKGFTVACFFTFGLGSLLLSWCFLYRWGEPERTTGQDDNGKYAGGLLLMWELIYHKMVSSHSAALSGLITRLLSINGFCALAPLLIAADPSSLDPLRFQGIGGALNVFVCMLMGFYLFSSVNRWLFCVESLMNLFEAIRNIQMQLHALGVEPEKINKTIHYGLLSVWLLRESMISDNEEEKAKFVARVSQDIRDTGDALLQLDDTEEKMLMELDDPAVHMWMLVASYMGRLAEDGDIPPMASPTYGRIINLVEAAHNAMRDMKKVVEIQVPFTYIQTLAVILHINSILCSISFGLTVGACTGSILAHMHLRFYSDVVPHPHHKMIVDMQDIIVQFVKCFLVPVLFHVFLEMGITMAQPFGSKAAIPLMRLFTQFRQDISDGRFVGENPTHWERPSFRRSMGMK